jgi:hypothetical protein
MMCRANFYDTPKCIDLPEEEPEIFSCILEYLYKGDYYPRLEYDKRRQSWQLEDGTNTDRQSAVEPTILLNEIGMQVLKDTVVYVSRSPPVSMPSSNPYPSAQPRSSASVNYNVLPSASKVSSPAFSVRPS